MEDAPSSPSQIAQPTFRRSLIQVSAVSAREPPTSSPSQTGSPGEKTSRASGSWLSPPEAPRPPRGLTPLRPARVSLPSTGPSLPSYLICGFHDIAQGGSLGYAQKKKRGPASRTSLARCSGAGFQRVWHPGCPLSRAYRRDDSRREHFHRDHAGKGGKRAEIVRHWNGLPIAKVRVLTM